MAKEFEWRVQTDYRIAPDPTYHLSHGVDPNTYEDWQTAQSGATGGGTWRFWFRDSNTSYQGQWVDAISSRFNIVITQSWTATIDNNNVLTVVVTTTADSAYRDDPQGSDQNTPGRHLTLYKEQGGSAVWDYTDYQIATAHSIFSSAINIGTETIVLQPGDASLVKSSLFLHNQTVGYSSYDDIWLGVQFRNPLPPDYIPGKVWNGSDWLSHNRATNGHAKLYTGSAWGSDMKTIDGGTSSGDPPEIWHSSSSKKNMRKIGLNS